MIAICLDGNYATFTRVNPDVAEEKYYYLSYEDNDIKH